jgi:Mg/Co/Ni transporter MgtE
MTTEYIALPVTTSVGDAVQAFRDFEGDIEIITDVYLLDADERITGIIPIARLLLAARESVLDDLPHGHLVTCAADANGRKVAELFDKYNLHSLPVVDRENRLVGIVHAEQVIALLRAQH